MNLIFKYFYFYFISFFFLKILRYDDHFNYNKCAFVYNNKYIYIYLYYIFYSIH